MSENPVREEERAAGYVYDVTQTFNGPIVFNGTVTFNGTILGVLAATGLQTSNAIVAVNLDPIGALGTVLTITGANRAAFVAPSVVVPGGANGTVQFNNAGAFGGIADSSWTDASKRLLFNFNDVTNRSIFEARPDTIHFINVDTAGTYSTDLYLNSDPFLQRSDIATPFKLSKVSAGIEYAEIESGRLNEYTAVTAWGKILPITNTAINTVCSTVLDYNKFVSATVHFTVRVIDSGANTAQSIHCVLLWAANCDGAGHIVTTADQIGQTLCYDTGTLGILCSADNPSGFVCRLRAYVESTGMGLTPVLTGMVLVESFGGAPVGVT